MAPVRDVVVVSECEEGGSAGPQFTLSAAGATCVGGPRRRSQLAKKRKQGRRIEDAHMHSGRTHTHTPKDTHIPDKYENGNEIELQINQKALTPLRDLET